MSGLPKGISRGVERLRARTSRSVLVVQLASFRNGAGEVGEG